MRTHAYTQIECTCSIGLWYVVDKRVIPHSARGFGLLLTDQPDTLTSAAEHLQCEVILPLTKALSLTCLLFLE